MPRPLAAPATTYMLSHRPVMVAEALAYLGPALAAPECRIVDGTVGFAGHALALLDAARRAAADPAAHTADRAPGPPPSIDTHAQRDDDRAPWLLALDRDLAAVESARGALVSSGVAVVVGETPPAGATTEAVDDDTPPVIAPSTTARVRVEHASYAGLADEAFRATVQDWLPANALLLDLGLSSPQLDERARGFSFDATDAPLDLRFDQTEGQPAAELIHSTTEAELEAVLREFGDERHARRIARTAVAAASEGAFRTVGDLVRVVHRATPAAAGARGGGRDRGRGPGRIHPATRTLQALRIWVNDELGALERLLRALPDIVAPSGRTAILSYHSGEDRRVKWAFRGLAERGTWDGRLGPDDPAAVPLPNRPESWRPPPVAADPVSAATADDPGEPRAVARRGSWRLVTSKPVTPTAEEIAANRRARSAKLRVIERLA